MAMEITGPLVLTSPAHQSAIPARGEKGPRRTLTQPVFEAATQQRREVPYITSNSVRGRFRRLAAQRVFNVFEARGETLSRDAFLVVSRGSIGRGDINVHGNANAIVESSRHVFAGLFGGGPAMLHSRFSVAQLLPLIQWTRDVLPPRLQRAVLPESAYVSEREQADGSRKQVVGLTATMMWTARDPLLDGMGANIVKDYAGTLADWLATMEGESAAHKAAAAAKKAPKKPKVAGDEEGDAEPEAEELGARSALKNFGEIRVLPPGLPLHFNVSTGASTSLAQDGLLLLTIVDWCALNSLGGNAARGFGRFNALGLEFTADGETYVPLFSARTSDSRYVLNMDAPEIRRRVEAAETALSALTAASIESAFGIAGGKASAKELEDVEA